jgi:UDP-3-O-[3-hydroxymyristoyl] N-acetylglucosamine deacetylase
MQIEGPGLHTGAPGAVRFTCHRGPVVLRSGGVDSSMTELRVVDTARSTTVANASGTIRIATIEHVLAALGGLGVHSGVAVVIEGAEAPLADGGARRYVDALRALGITPSPPPLRVVRDGVVVVGKSRYELRRLDDADAVELEIEVDFGDARLARTASWSGDADDFGTRIAGARTFGFEHEIEELLARELASHVTPESVVVIAEAGILSRGAPFTADEPARHKLLDLIGDLYLHGGPPRGGIRAARPGHAVTHEVIRRAREDGLLVSDVG